MAKPGLFRSRKFARLARLLGAQYRAVGVLEMIWHYAYEDGDPNVGSAEDVEYMVGWDGEPGRCAAALVEAGFLDECDGELLVHDLLDHAPGYVRERLRKRRQRAAKAGMSGTDPDASRDCPGTVPGQSHSCPGTVPHIPSPPNPTQVLRGGKGSSREEVGNSEAPAPAAEPPAPPEDQIPTRDGQTWWPSEKTLDKLRREYPEVDLEAVARDMGRKIRAGARRPYTARGMPRAFAAWVAAEARRLEEERARNGTNNKRGFDPHVGKNDGWQFGFSRADQRAYSQHPLWDAYVDECYVRCGWGGELAPWPAFSAWLRGRERPKGGEVTNGRKIMLVNLVAAADRAKEAGREDAARILAEAAEQIPSGKDPVELLDDVMERLAEVLGLGGAPRQQLQAVLEDRFGLRVM